MKIERIVHELTQGSDAWHQFRQEHDGASEAAAMLGLSKYLSRSELLRQKATGLAPEVDAGKQRLFDAGHASEAAARPMAETILGEELYPATYSYGRLSASCDGLTMGGDTAFEHKLWSADLAASVARGELPEEYQPQCQQIMLVTGAEQVLFMVSDGTPENCVHTLVKPHGKWIERIKAGWAMFHQDLEVCQHVEVLPAAVAAPTMALPALSIQVRGEITLIDNLKVFGERLNAFIDGIDKNPSTDQAFADAEGAIKTLGTAQTALEAAEAGALAQTASIDEMRRTVALYADQARTTRLMLEKLVRTRKEQIRVEIVMGGKDALAKHVAMLTLRLGKPYMPVIQADFAGVIKGKKTITSLRDAVDTELARAKIAANAIADAIGINLNTLRDLATDHAFLFADTPQLVLKSNDDLTAIIRLRIADHKVAEEKRLEAERERIRREEEAKAAQKLASPVSLPASVAVLVPPTVAAAPAPAPSPTAKVQRPTDDEIIAAVAQHFRVHPTKAVAWLLELDLEAATDRLTAPS